MHLLVATQLNCLCGDDSVEILNEYNVLREINGSFLYAGGEKILMMFYTAEDSALV